MAGSSGPEKDQPRPLPEAHFVPRILRRPEMVVAPPVTRASGAQLDDDAKIREFLRQHGVTALATHAQPIASDRVPSEGSQADQPRGFVPRELREAMPVVTPSQAPSPVATAAVTVAPGSICPTCQRRVPASAAERQRAYRKRQREQRQGLAGD
jgi:hypothetical protein